MRLRSLRLRNHRNYAQLDLTPGPGVNLFIGANGQGKTNLLEAVAMLALSASPRSRKEIELVGPVAPMSRIEAEVESRGITAQLAITLNVEGDRARRVIEVDGIRRRAFDLPGHFRLQNSLLQQPGGEEAPLFQLLEVSLYTFWVSHARNIAQGSRNVTILFNAQ